MKVDFYLALDFVSILLESLVKAFVKFSDNKFKFYKLKAEVDSALVLIATMISLIFSNQLKTIKIITVLS